MRFWISLLSISGAFATKQCPIKTEVKQEEVNTLSADLLNFGSQLYKRFAEGQTNVIFSPASISTVLSMLYSGAGGQTAKELANVLYPSLQNAEDNKVPALYNKLLTQFRSKSDSDASRLEVANAIYASDQISFKNEFINVITGCYHGEAKSMDFVAKTEESREEINDFVENRTNHRIKDLIPTGAIAPETTAVFVNTMYFKDRWAYPFEEKDTEKDHEFELEDGSTKVKVDMLSQEPDAHFHFPYYDDDEVKILGMPYSGNQVEMMFMVPKKGFSDFMSKSTGQVFSQYFQKARDGEDAMKSIKFPKFKFDFQTNLKDHLKALGLESIFQNNADFSKARPGMKVDEGFHKAFIEVNEKGTEAAAATAMVLIPMSLPPPATKEFVADKPFLFFILHRPSQQVLFMGKVTDPTK